MKPFGDEQLQRAYRYAMSLSNNHDLAKDVVHSAYVKMLEKNVVHVNNPQHYFLRCIRNLFIDQKRVDNRWSIVDEEDGCDHTVDITIDSLELMVINQNLLKILWAEFSPTERELLYLWAIEEYTIKEISELTDIPRGTLLSKIHRIRKKVAGKNLSKGIGYE